MTSIQSLIAFSGMQNQGNAAGSQAGSGGFEALLFSFTGSPAQTDSSSAITAANSVKISNGTDNDDGMDQLLKFIEQVMANINNSLQDIGADPATARARAVTADANADTSTASAESALAGGGPLPIFLAQVDARMHLNDTQKQALQDIAMENMNVVKSPETVQQIAMELQQAGI